MILRVNPPGQPVRYIELGPARARLSSRDGSMGGPLSEQESHWTKAARLKRERERAEREAAG